MSPAPSLPWRHWVPTPTGPLEPKVCQGSAHSLSLCAHTCACVRACSCVGICLPLPRALCLLSFWAELDSSILVVPPLPGPCAVCTARNHASEKPFKSECSLCANAVPRPGRWRAFSESWSTCSSGTQESISFFPSKSGKRPAELIHFPGGPRQGLGVNCM